ncbi:MAG: hypothetical protein ACI4KR_08875 [Ruminiclostridium sp.]
MNSSIFRKKSIDSISSPEQLTDYIRASNPGVWLALGAIAVLLIGICVWGVFGKLDTKITAAAESENGKLVCYIKESDIEKIRGDMQIHINGASCNITEISSQPIAIEEDFPEYAMHLGDLKTGEWVFVITTDGTAPEGIYPAQIVVESISPISFVFN